jgi:flagellar motor switch/type III secretory pathway protein FliN
MSDLTPWLPAEALNPSHFEGAISSLVGDWSSHWFAKARANCRPQLRSTMVRSPQQLAWRSSRQQFGTCLDEAGRLALAEAMLDRAIAANAVQVGDQPLLSDITDRCLDDLLGRLSWLIDHERTPDLSGEAMEPSWGIAWDIGLKRSGVAISLVISRSALVRWRKRLAPTSKAPELAGIFRALKSQQVGLRLDIGRGSLILAELENLAPGDVIILDRTVDAPLELLAAGRASGIKGKLKEEAGRASVEIIDMKKVAK